MSDLDEAVKAAAKVLVDAVVSLLDEDGHQYGTRPCPTCRTVSGLIGRPFGCSRVALRWSKA